MTEKIRSANQRSPSQPLIQGTSEGHLATGPKDQDARGGPARSPGHSRTQKRNGQRHTSARGPSKPNIYGALDLGTNNCRLLLARPTDSGFKVVDGFSKIVRLGEGMSTTGALSPAAMDRTIEALRQCKNKIGNHKIARLRLIATEACRSASNADEFLSRIRAETGIELEVVDRKTEAQLAVTGCADLVDQGASGAVIFDIGGGSSELAWLDFRGGRPKARGKMAASIRSWQSLPVGVVSIAEKFDGVNVTPESFEDMIDYVREHLKRFKGREKLKRAITESKMHLVGTSARSPRWRACIWGWSAMTVPKSTGFGWASNMLSIPCACC